MKIKYKGYNILVEKSIFAWNYFVWREDQTIRDSLSGPASTKEFAIKRAKAIVDSAKKGVSLDTYFMKISKEESRYWDKKVKVKSHKKRI